MKLFFREYGQGPPLVILHGLFGSSDNWLTQAKLFATQYTVYLVDLRNHGQSPHSDAFNYAAMVDDLNEFFEFNHLTDAFLIGHSMGGKTAMNFALTHPRKVRKLIVVDIAPRAYNLEHHDIVLGLKAIPIDSITSRNEADEVLSPYVPEIGVRQFLLKNLQRLPTGGFTWKINLPVIADQLDNIGLGVTESTTFEGPTLFVRGSSSAYIRDSDWGDITKVFPLATLETMETGHWVQAEKPEEFVALTTRWLNA